MFKPYCSKFAYFELIIILIKTILTVACTLVLEPPYE